VYGLPILFPPNRIDGGKFEFSGRTYQFPIGEKRSNNSLHGFLSHRPWGFEVLKSDKDEAVVSLTFKGDKEEDYYSYYPHEFTIKMVYTLNAQGLNQDITISNEGRVDMPFGLGWHTAFALEFKEGINPDDVKVKVSIGGRIQLSDRGLPTGVVSPLSDNEAQFRKEGQSPLYEIMDDHYTVKPIEKDGKPFHGAILEDGTGKARVVYRVDPAYKHWMIWNCFKEGSFICIEPQNWRVNAPNLKLPADESGMEYIVPGGTYRAKASVYVEEDLD
ncbi:MAG TPA: aldose 1-epimerase, partial [Clostridia bacterium]|nr:aldose 1-epimerase [Clostridia bacterium]